MTGDVVVFGVAPKRGNLWRVVLQRKGTDHQRSETVVAEQVDAVKAWLRQGPRWCCAACCLAGHRLEGHELCEPLPSCGGGHDSQSHTEVWDRKNGCAVVPVLCVPCLRLDAKERGMRFGGDEHAACRGELV
jgi:hypothetical protein